MFEKIERVDGALIYHGDFHNRIFISEINQENLETILPKMKQLAKRKKYQKILGRAPENVVTFFKKQGFEIEAKIPGLYNGNTSGYFLADYPNGNGSISNAKILKTIETVKSIARAANKPNEKAHMELPVNCDIIKINSVHYGDLAQLNAKAYKYHPSHIVTEQDLLDLANLNHQFYGLYEGGVLLVYATIQFHPEEANLEIVDFTTHPDYRGQNLSYYLVQELKNKMDTLHCKTIYSLVRATSYGLNITYSKHGFKYAGTLTNNALVRESIESMNVWFYNNFASRNNKTEF
jgi:putative beta-lysine N-acetyltransferase